MASNTNIYSGLKWYEYLVCALPIAFIAVGGLIGGAIGGGAFVFNLRIWKSNRTVGKKYFLVLLITFLAFIVTAVLDGLVYHFLKV